MGRLLGGGFLVLGLGRSHRIHRFFVAATMACLLADESFRLGLGARLRDRPFSHFLGSRPSLALSMTNALPDGSTPRAIWPCA